MNPLELSVLTELVEQRIAELTTRGAPRQPTDRWVAVLQDLEQEESK